MNSGKDKLAFVPEYELCRGCKIIRECYQKREKANRKTSHGTLQRKSRRYT